MTKGYWIAQVDIDDPEEYKHYIAANAAPLAKFGAKFLVRGGDQNVQEGTWRSRVVVVEFDSYETALACYNDQGYQTAKALRQAVSTGDFLIIKGFED